jgi:hypothetical protein
VIDLANAFPVGVRLPTGTANGYSHQRNKTKATLSSSVHVSWARFRVTVIAVQHIRRMHGGAQGHLMRCSDNHFYVVKFRNNPQHFRVLANEFLATRLAEKIGLPVPATEVVEVSGRLVDQTPELHIELTHDVIRCQPGLQFGSRYVVSPKEGQVFDYMPVELLNRVRNLETFAGMLVVDKWTGNTDGRQAVFWRKVQERKYTAAFIDQGGCFNAGKWTFPDCPLHGVHARNEVYAGVRGWASFQPWLSRVEKMEEESIWHAAGEIPPEWYGGEWHEVEKLIGNLIVRQKIVRDLIKAFRVSTTNPFPEWQKTCSPDEGGVRDLFRRLKVKSSVNS